MELRFSENGGYLRGWSQENRGSAGLEFRCQAVHINVVAIIQSA